MLKHLYTVRNRAELTDEALLSLFDSRVGATKRDKVVDHVNKFTLKLVDRLNQIVDKFLHPPAKDVTKAKRSSSANFGHKK